MPRTDDVATYSVSDPDADSTHDWTLEGTDAASFSITDGVLSFNHRRTTRPNPCTPTVKATDNGTPALSDTITVTVNVTNVNEAPTVRNSAADFMPRTAPMMFYLLRHRS